MSHAFAVRSALFPAEDQLAFPESERAVLLECRHTAEDSFVIEMRHAPLQRLDDFRAAGMNQFANVDKDWFGKVGGLGDVRINARVFRWHGRNVLREMRPGQINFLALASNHRQTNTRETSTSQ